MSFEDLHDTTAAHELRIVRCRTCRAKIIWFKTEAGKNMPVDADSVKAEDDKYDQSRHIAHWATCPDADHHRKKSTKSPRRETP